MRRYSHSQRSGVRNAISGLQPCVSSSGSSFPGTIHFASATHSSQSKCATLVATQDQPAFRKLRTFRLGPAPAQAQASGSTPRRRRQPDANRLLPLLVQRQSAGVWWVWFCFEVRCDLHRRVLLSSCETCCSANRMTGSVRVIR